MGQHTVNIERIYNVSASRLPVLLGLLICVFVMCKNAEAGDKLSGSEIMDRVALTRKLDGSESLITLTNISENGKKRVRKMALASKLYDGGKTEKLVYKFISPEDVKGTGILTFDYEDKSDDVWIYFPALRKTRRILGAQQSKSFMGSEFTYVDLNIPKLENYAYKILKEEVVDGELCYAVENKPKDEKIARDEGYAKKIVWVAKSDFTVRKVVYFDLKGDELKQMNIKEIKLLDPQKNRYRPMYMKMKNLKNGRSSILKTLKIEFNPDVKDTYFRTGFLERP